MAILKKMLYHYFVGVLISTIIIIMIVLFDYYIKGYLQYPELKNFIKVSVISGAGFGLTLFTSTKIK